MITDELRAGDYIGVGVSRPTARTAEDLDALHFSVSGDCVAGYGGGAPMAWGINSCDEFIYLALITASVGASAGGDAGGAGSFDIGGSCRVGATC